MEAACRTRVGVGMKDESFFLLLFGDTTDEYDDDVRERACVCVRLVRVCTCLRPDGAKGIRSVRRFFKARRKEKTNPLKKP